MTFDYHRSSDLFLGLKATSLHPSSFVWIDEKFKLFFLSSITISTFVSLISFK